MSLQAAWCAEGQARLGRLAGAFRCVHDEVDIISEPVVDQCDGDVVFQSQRPDRDGGNTSFFTIDRDRPVLFGRRQAIAFNKQTRSSPLDSLVANTPKRFLAYEVWFHVQINEASQTEFERVRVGTGVGPVGQQAALNALDAVGRARAIP